MKLAVKIGVGILVVVTIVLVAVAIILHMKVEDLAGPTGCAVDHSCVRYNDTEFESLDELYESLSIRAREAESPDEIASDALRKSAIGQLKRQSVNTKL